MDAIFGRISCVSGVLCVANCENNCINEYRILALENDMQHNAVTHKEFFDRFEKMNGRMVGYEKDMSYLTATMTDISKDVKEIKEKPTKRYETAVVCAITAVVSALIGFLMNGILPM